MTPQEWERVKEIAPVQIADFLSHLWDELVTQDVDMDVRADILIAATPVVTAKLMEGNSNHAK